MESLICISLSPQFNITGVTKNGLVFLGYADLRELEFQSISVLIPMPSSALHGQIFSEMQKTYTDKGKYFEITKLGDSAMNDRIHAKSPAEVLERLEDPHAVKWVLTKSGKQKKAAIYIDMKVDRSVDVYMLPIDTSPSGSRSASPLPSSTRRDSDSDSDSSDTGSRTKPRSSGATRDHSIDVSNPSSILKGHFELRNSSATPALVSVLRAIKDL